MKLILQKSEEFWVIAITLLIAWLLAAHQSSHYAVFGVAGSYLYWTCRLLIEATFFIAALMAVEKYLKQLIPEWMGYALAILFSLLPFTLTITSLDLIVGLPELGLNGDTTKPALRVKAFALEICYLLDNHIFLSMLLLLPRWLSSGKAQIEESKAAEHHPEIAVTNITNNTSDSDIPLSFFESLEPPLKGYACAMEAQEHYIQITTTGESRMVLHRFSNAVKQTPPTLGMQVHRSHWVAHSAVQEIIVDGQSMKLKLGCGKVVPVSRTFRSIVEDKYYPL